MFTSPGFWIFVLCLYLVVEAGAGLYVRVKHGADMVGSDYHQALTVLWTLRVLTGLFIAGFIFCVMFFTVLLDGQVGYFFEAVGRMLGLTWDLVVLVIGSFYKILFR